MTEIARQKNISTSSVYRVMKRFYRPLNPFKQTLPRSYALMNSNRFEVLPVQ